MQVSRRGGVSLNRATSKAAAFWFAAIATVGAFYWLCLRFLFPGYFAPLSAFHVDFYDYAAIAVNPIGTLVARYPRPVSCLAMKVLAWPGFRAMLSGIVLLALANLLLTVALARQIFELRSLRVLAPFAFYILILFAHPQFYIEHRHDLPAEVSYLFFALSLLAWVAFVSGSGARAQPLQRVLLVAALACAALFVFAKETYFISALCVVAGLALSNRSRWRIHACFFGLLVLLECISFAWNLHLSGPFVNVSATAANTYKIDLSPVSVLRCYSFYLSHLLNPALTLLPLVGIAAVWRDRARLILAVAFLLAGLAVFVPHAVLPNHLFAEYAWAAAPILLVPVLLVSPSGVRIQPAAAQVHRHRIQLPWAFALAALLTVLVIAGPGGYVQEYRTSEERWMVDADRKGAALAGSLAPLHSISAPARVLVVGLEDTAIPWESGAFISSQFGDRVFWSVLLPRSIGYRRRSRLVEFPDPQLLHLQDFDRIATYNAADQLTGIRSTSSIPASEPRLVTFVPAAASLLSEMQSRPHDAGPPIQTAQLALDWGFWKEAGRYLDEAEQQGATGQMTRPLTAMIAAARASEAPPIPATLILRPAHVVQPDGSGLAETGLSWTIPDGRVCEIRINAPAGPLFAAIGESGQARTGKWVTNGMQFFLQDVSGGKPLDAKYTLAQATVVVTRE